MKVLVPLGVGLAGLVAFASKANAKPGAPSGPGPAKTSGAQPLTTVQVADMMTKALASADPKTLLDLADKLEKQGFTQQAADLRSVAATLSKVGATAAGATPPPFVPSGPVTPPANIPQASPSSPNVIVPPPIQLPNMVVTAPAPTTAPGPSAAERDVAAQLVIDQQSKPKWKDNRDLTTLFQIQESKAGSYKNIVTGEPGKVDGLYGPGSAIALAERFGMVPPPPKYWPKNPAPALTAYKARLMKLAAADPVRASEWSQAAQKAKVT